VRATDAAAVGHLLTGIAARIHAGLIRAASGINDEAADHLATAIADYAAALGILENAALTEEFHVTLAKLIESATAHPKTRGQSVRLLRDGAHLDDATVARHLGFALSPGMPALSAAAWLEGFLRGGGSLLVHDRTLLGLVDDWLASLHPENFQTILPLIRRTFGTFTTPERARIAASIAKQGQPTASQTTTDLDLTRAMPAVRAVAELFSLQHP
jgi:hypothetical protein